MATGAWLSGAFGFLIPVGLFLMGWGGIEPHRARRAVTLGSLSLALAVVGYFAVGFALHLGGAHIMAPDLPGLEGLNRSWGPSEDWVLFGLAGFFLGADVATPDSLVLFVTYLPMVAAAVLVPVLSLSGRSRGWQVALGGLAVATVVFPLAACWVWGGGWLSRLGGSLNLGFGTVDYAGSMVVYLLGGCFALGGLLSERRLPSRRDPDATDQMPPAHFPLLANLGSLLFALGWLAWALSTPFHVAGAELNVPMIAVNGLLAGSGAALASQLYCWLTTGHADALMASRGAATGIVAVSAAAPFIAPWAALVVGAAAGGLFPLAQFLTTRVARLADVSGAVPMGIVGGVLGSIAVPFFADGRWGRRWNGLVLDDFRLRAGQGVTGFFPAPGLGFVASGIGQTLAQLAALGAISALGLLSGALVSVLLSAPGRYRRRAAARAAAAPPPASDGAAAALAGQDAAPS